MLHFERVLEEDQIMNIEPIGDIISKKYEIPDETLIFYDDKLNEIFIDKFLDNLNEKFDISTKIPDFQLYIHPSNVLERIDVELTLYYDPKKDKSEQIEEAKSSFEKCYKKIVYPYYKKQMKNL